MTAGHRFPAQSISQPDHRRWRAPVIASTDIGLDDPANDHLRTVTLADARRHDQGAAHPHRRCDELSSSAHDDPCCARRAAPGRAVRPGAGVRRPARLSPVQRGRIRRPRPAHRRRHGPALRRRRRPPGARTAGHDRLVVPRSLPGMAGIGRRCNGYDLQHPTATPSCPCLRISRPSPPPCGLWTTAADLVRFGTGWASLLPASLAREAFRPQARMAPGEGSMGLGWFIDRDRAGAGRGGAGPGTTASLAGPSSQSSAEHPARWQTFSAPTPGFRVIRFA